MTNDFLQNSQEESVRIEEKTRNQKVKEEGDFSDKEKIHPSFDVLIPTYKPGDKFRALLSALEEQEYPPNKIIIVNTEEQYFPKELLEGR